MLHDVKMARKVRLALTDGVDYATSVGSLSFLLYSSDPIHRIEADLQIALLRLLVVQPHLACPPPTVESSIEHGSPVVSPRSYELKI